MSVSNKEYDNGIYTSFQDSINNSDDPDDELSKYLEHKQLVEISKTDRIPMSTRIAYITKDGLFRSGGFLVEKNPVYMLYTGFNGQVFSLQLCNIKNLYIKVKKVKVNPIIFKFPKEKTDYPVYIGPDIVYYAGSNSRRDQFMSTKKFNRALNQGFIFK